MIAILDTGGVSALAPTDERARARLRALREQVDDMVIPAAVLTEGVLSGHPGRDHQVRRLLQSVEVATLDEALGFAAGRLRSECLRADDRHPPSGVDAAVTATADARAGTTTAVIVTGDPGDIGALAAHATNRQRLSVRSV